MSRPARPLANLTTEAGRCQRWTAPAAERSRPLGLGAGLGVYDCGPQSPGAPTAMAHAKSTGNPNDFILPDLGEGVHEAELIAWKVQVGQTVAEHDILAEMETDKALVEVPSPRAGTIAALHGNPGEILKV